VSSLVPSKKPVFARVGLDPADAAEIIRDNWEEFRKPWSEDLHTPLHNLLERQRQADCMREWARDCLWCIQHSHGTEGVTALIRGLVDPLDWNTEGKHLWAFLDDARKGLDGRT